MRRLFVILSMVLVVFAFGCSKNNESTKKAAAEAEKKPHAAKIAVVVDPVSKKMVNKDSTKYVYTYNSVKYYFESEKNMKEFKSNPTKYIGK